MKVLGDVIRKADFPERLSFSVPNQFLLDLALVRLKKHPELTLYECVQWARGQVIELHASLEAERPECFVDFEDTVAHQNMHNRTTNGVTIEWTSPLTRERNTYSIEIKQLSKETVYPNTTREAPMARRWRLDNKAKAPIDYTTD